MCNIPFTLVIPQHLQEEIVNCLEDAVHIARVKCVCKSFRYAANRVRSLRIICKEEYHASIRNENPTTALAAVQPRPRGTDRDILSTSRADVLTDDIQKTKNDGTPVAPLHDTQNSSGTGTGVSQDCQSDSGIINNHPLEKVAEGPDAPRKVVEGSDSKKRTRGQRETLSEAEICDHQLPSNENSSDHALRNTSHNCDTFKGDLPETIRDDNGNFPNGSTKRPKCEGNLHVGDSQAGKARSPETEMETDTEKGHLQETHRDDNRNFLSGSSKKFKLQEEFAAENLQDGDASTSRASKEPIYFRGILPGILQEVECITQLRIEVEPKLQSKVVPREEHKCTDHWMTDPLFVNKWIRYVQATIQHLCIVDYGWQAIARKSSILTIISETCFLLKTLDLRNMFLDATKGWKDMPNLASFTLRSSKVIGNVLQEINMRMRNLQTLALLEVLGVQEGHLTLPELKVLCLGFSIKAKSVKIELPNLVKLQLKMTCPDVLHIHAPALQFMAFNLEILDCSVVGFESIKNLRELLYTASQFTMLSKLLQGNVLLDKIFLDIPCMALEEDGNWLGVLNDVAINVPSFETLQSECPNLQVLNIGPGLCHSMEMVHYTSLTGVQAWPPITRLILHMIPHTLETSLKVLLLLITVMPKLQILELKVHTNSPVDYDCLIDAIKSAIKSHTTHLKFRAGRWTKTVDFSCFSF